MTAVPRQARVGTAPGPREFAVRPVWTSPLVRVTHSKARQAGEASSVHDHNSLQVTVEAPIPAVRLIRLAGRLDRTAAASVLRVVSVQLDLVAGGHQAVTDLVLDIEQVHCFEPGGLESLRHAPYTAGQRGIGVCLSGCGGRVAQLPLQAGRLLSEFRTFPTSEVALEMLTTTRRRVGPAAPVSD
jgi:anti-anti-sigma regulatory factor